MWCNIEDLNLVATYKLSDGLCRFGRTAMPTITMNLPKQGYATVNVEISIKWSKLRACMTFPLRKNLATPFVLPISIS